MQIKAWTLGEVHSQTASTLITFLPNSGVWWTTRKTKLSAGTPTATPSSSIKTPSRDRSCLRAPSPRRPLTPSTPPTSQASSVSSICTASRKLIQRLKTATIPPRTVGPIIGFATQTSNETIPNLLRVWEGWLSAIRPSYRLVWAWTAGPRVKTSESVGAMMAAIKAGKEASHMTSVQG